MRVTFEQEEFVEKDEDELPEKPQYLDFLKETEMCMSLLFLIVVETHLCQSYKEKYLNDQR
jgi:hypothetical protein